MIMLITYPMIFLTIVFLFYLAYEDLRAREIDSLLVYILSGVGIVYNLCLGIANGFWKPYLLQLVIAIVFFLIVYALGKLTIYAYIGEGDLLVLLMISATSGYSLLLSEFVFLLALIFMLFMPVIFLVFNILKGNFPDKASNEKFWFMLLGVPVKIPKLSFFVTPLQKFVLRKGKLKSETVIRPDCNPEKQIQEIKGLPYASKIKKVWVSPLMPFILEILIAYILVLFLLSFDKLAFLGSFAGFFV